VTAQNLVDLYMKLYAVIPEETLRELARAERKEKEERSSVALPPAAGDWGRA